MITGFFLRHYKTYRGLYFIPIGTDYNNKYSIFVGNNGVGKSSIMEGLDTFFNNAPWNKNKQGKKDETFVAPIFLIEKETIRYKIDSRAYKFIEFLSDYFWNSSSAINPNLNSIEAKNFFQYRDELKEKYDPNKYFLFMIGVRLENKNKVFFSTFTKDIENNIPEELSGFEVELLLNVVRDLYSYIYIPVETTTSEILKIENQEMQELMSTDILHQIDSILNEKNFTEGRKSISAIDYLNNSLNKYMESINKIIGDIDDNYAYKVEGI